MKNQRTFSWNVDIWKKNAEGMLAKNQINFPFVLNMKINQPK